MQLVDNKGRLFGLINLVDLIVIILVALLAFGGYSRISSRLHSSGEPVVLQDIEVDFFIKEVMMFTTNNFQPGDIVKDSDSGVILGTVKNVEVEPFKEAVLDSQGNLVSREVPEMFNITITIETKAQVTPQGIRVQGKEILIGDIHIVQTHKSKARVVVVNVRE